MKNENSNLPQTANDGNAVLAEVKQTATKKKISAFEFAIMEVADSEGAKNYEPFTKEEETQMRVDKLMNQAKRMQIKHED